MKTSEIFKAKKVFSFEIFPPKRTAPVDTIYETVAQLRDLAPDFISVTYGAGGSENNTETLRIARAVKNDYGIESVAHLPSVNLTRSDALALLDEFRAAGIENILALRGDVNPNFEPKEDFRYASDLVSFIKENGDFHVIGAAYPEGHRECARIEDDIRNLKVKVDAGAKQLITQLFFDNAAFYAFRERVAHAGIEVPIQAGIMPITNKNQLERMATLCGASIPTALRSLLDAHDDDPDGLLDAGITYAIEQIGDLMAQGTDGIHLYTMNNPEVARRIHAATHKLFAS
ncbi:MAG: methylenetetrahydrofolate reductase [NAD(P)H] [Coriobacteriales bacterium]|jgi:methylenetetrahydrofolate reductase (NADPH)|nr:methylenetetrahydrofolate reductase [NAD(P)H] [Coriobacteriales bacterium]